MNKEQTEKLRKRIVEILYGETTYKNYLAVPKVRHNADMKIAKILQACKEAGLKFVLPVITSDPEIGNERIEEIELEGGLNF